MKQILTAQAAQTVDHDAIHVRGISGTALMQTAGTAAGKAALDLCRDRELDTVQIFCGKGNNGGDGYVAATFLKNAGLPHVDVFCFAPESGIRGDARHHYDIMKNSGIAPYHIDNAKTLISGLKHDACWVDAVFGTGLDRPVSGFLLQIMETLRDAHTGQPVVAADIPSGISGTSGRRLGPVLKATVTLSMGFYKSGHFLQDGKTYCGELRCADLDYPDGSMALAEPKIYLCDQDLIKGKIRPVPVTAHKYMMGQVLCVGGSAAMPGAVTLASQAALRGGAGMLRAFVPRSVKTLLLHRLTEAIADTGNDGDILIERDLPLIRALQEKSRAMVLGPGMGRTTASGKLVRTLLEQSTLPMVLDADGIYHANPDVLKNAGGPVIITPHAGEFARLVRKSVDDILNDPVGQALELAQYCDTIVHLKGSTSLTALPSGAVYLHLTGAPGMATAGSGDLLAGLIASFIAQGHSPEDAVLIGAYYHGLAGQAAAEQLGNRSMIASDILNCLPLVLKKDEVLA